MSDAADMEVRQRVVRWLEEGQSQLSTMLGFLSDYERIRIQAAETERECERLRGFVYENEKLRNQLELLESEGTKLREEIHRLRVENEQHAREREEIAASLTETMNGLLRRLRRDAA
jgi:chromosome segregation ATPase